MYDLDGDFIRRIAPTFTGDKKARQTEIIDALSPVFADVLDQYEIDTRLRIAHFMGQVTHECAGFRTTEEFATGDAYEHRLDLGNTEPGDGRRYKGRGLLQLTGRANYRRLGERLGLPLEDRPEIAADPVVSLKIACEYWTSRKINVPADDDDLVAVTKKVNGGTNGLADRGVYLKKAKAVLAEMDAGVAGSAPEPAAMAGDGRPVLHRGAEGPAVGLLQKLLRAKGLPVAIDREFGAGTDLAVQTFQKSVGLPSDGIVGPATWAALGG